MNAIEVQGTVAAGFESVRAEFAAVVAEEGGESGPQLSFIAPRSTPRSFLPPDTPSTSKGPIPHVFSRHLDTPFPQPETRAPGTRRRRPAETAVDAYWDLARISYVREAFDHLGYPLYFATILGVAKAGALAAIVTPDHPRTKEWAYAGLVFVYGGAATSHLAVGAGPDNGPCHCCSWPVPSPPAPGCRRAPPPAPRCAHSAARGADPSTRDPPISGLRCVPEIETVDAGLGDPPGPAATSCPVRRQNVRGDDRAPVRLFRPKKTHSTIELVTQVSPYGAEPHVAEQRSSHVG
ncbi:DoxX family protein [Nocardia rhizosphaerihabitans]|uniref:Uncharacterized protein n=1 Tax=Nocardia rhizosphaerihabitans TaxID=1691570 RepID=A0ABQ2KI40_9NOCA|nr:DoxX family protein [Nocardia rhizosphaerihabitans]GGN82682.1 hypothetical protein GCM10011610_34290 [Nocardia rhizosphaerihabitans]